MEKYHHLLHCHNVTQLSYELLPPCSGQPRLWSRSQCSEEANYQVYDSKQQMKLRPWQKPPQWVKFYIAQPSLALKKHSKLSKAYTKEATDTIMRLALLLLFQWLKLWPRIQVTILPSVPERNWMETRLYCRTPLSCIYYWIRAGMSNDPMGPSNWHAYLLSTVWWWNSHPPDASIMGWYVSHLSW